MMSGWIEGLQPLGRLTDPYEKTGSSCSIVLAREDLRDAVVGLYEEGFFLEDITGMDFAEGFATVYHFDHPQEPCRASLYVTVSHQMPAIPSISDIFTGAEWHEREVADFFGIRFTGHPDPAPLLVPDDMDSPPLIKGEEDRIPFEGFLNACGGVDKPNASQLFSQGEPQHALPDPGLRRSEGEDDPDTMVINMGPQHPSTHGVLRVILRLDGEYIVEARPVIGYLHRMHEKMAETRTWVQYIPNMGRVDYLNAMAWNWAYVGAVERLAQIRAPERAEYIRVIVSELNRISSHLVWWGALLLDLGAFTPIMYGFEDREHILDLLQVLTGSRLTYSFFRPGGVAGDVNDDFLKGCLKFVRHMRERLPMYAELVTENIIFRRRTEGIGLLPLEMCRRYGATGPVVRGSNLAYDVRRVEPYSIYHRFDFKIPVDTGCDAMGRYCVRMAEIEESLKIVEQAVEQIPGGDHILKKSPGPRWKAPPGEAYFAVEGARGKIGVYVVSDGGPKPYRVKLRAPGFSNLSLFGELVKGALFADAVSILGSLDLVIPEIDR
ncbi:MAG: NADH-quinone oxidoreductase subunit D [Deltaproteobacteria bacterium]|nr:NADH-quinone oxidoreductase subunit D [Deltaproteobacteria bacterium]MBW2049459.1 NADH-quinone oxidoreductase subunit D [Deltaproteobacteria bacterium]